MIKIALMADRGPAADDVLTRWSCSDDGFPGIRQRSLLCRALLRRLLVDATGLSATGWTFIPEASGRLIARHSCTDFPPFVSLSHSGRWVACAASDVGPLGIDIETHCPHHNLYRIANAIYGPSERAQVTKYGVAGFYRIWTLKEAMAKASGRGIAEVIDCTDRVTGGPKEGSWRTDDGKTLWWLAYATPLSGLSIAIAIDETGCPPPGLPIAQSIVGTQDVGTLNACVALECSPPTFRA
jgi:4'-phosphopantetheinyl transferase